MHLKVPNFESMSWRYTLSLLSFSMACLLETEISDTDISLLALLPIVKDVFSLKSTIWIAFDAQSMSDSRIKYGLPSGRVSSSKNISLSGFVAL